MTWTSFAIAPRRRLIVTALMYGLTLSILMTQQLVKKGSVPVQLRTALLSRRSLSTRSRKPAFRMADIQGPPRTYMCGAGCQPTLPT